MGQCPPQGSLSEVGEGQAGPVVGSRAGAAPKGFLGHVFLQGNRQPSSFATSIPSGNLPGLSRLPAPYRGPGPRRPAARGGAGLRGGAAVPSAQGLSGRQAAGRVPRRIPPGEGTVCRLLTSGWNSCCARTRLGRRSPSSLALPAPRAERTARPGAQGRAGLGDTRWGPRGSGTR